MSLISTLRHFQGQQEAGAAAKASAAPLENDGCTRDLAHDGAEEDNDIAVEDFGCIVAAVRGSLAFAPLQIVRSFNTSDRRLLTVRWWRLRGIERLPVLLAWTMHLGILSLERALVHHHRSPSAWARISARRLGWPIGRYPSGSVHWNMSNRASRSHIRPL